MEFTKIPVDESYAISECGVVFSYKSNKVIKSHLDTGGYFRISLGRKKYTIHRLVAITHIGFPKDELMVINHKNGNKLDNHKDNLEWCTIHENSIHYLLYLKHFDSEAYIERITAIGVCDIYEKQKKPKKPKGKRGRAFYFSEEKYPIIYELCRKKIPVRFIVRKFEDVPLHHIKSIYNFINGKKTHYLSV